MQVITIQSEVWSLLQLTLQEIQTSMKAKDKNKSLATTWLTIDEALTMLKVSKRTLQNYRDKGKLGFSKIDGKIYFKESEINNFLERHYHQPFYNN